MSSTAGAPAWRGYLYVGLVVSIWTGFVITSRLAGKGGALTVFDVTALRFGVAAVLLIPLLVWRGGFGTLSDPKRLLACSLTGGLGYALLAYGGFYFAPAAHGSILLSGIMPFITTLIAWFALGERPGPQKRLALALIAGGMVSMALQTFGHGSDGDSWIGDLLFVSASTSWCVYTVLLRRWKVAAWDAAAGVAVTSAVLYLPIYLLFLPKQLLAAPAWELALQAGYQGVLVVIVAMVFYTRAVAELGPTRLAACMAMVPALSALLAVVILDEPLAGLLPLGIALVSVGALVGALARSQSPAPAAEAAVAGHHRGG